MANVLERCAKLPWRALFQLYADLLADSPNHAPWAAMALRDKARAGELEREAVPLLALCLRDAVQPGSIVAFAKALAAFGREAEVASGLLMDKIRALHVIDDETFWVFDGCLYSLGYLGGDGASAFLAELEGQKPIPVCRSGKIYEGRITEAERTEMFGVALHKVRKMLAGDPGRWTSRATQLEPTSEAPKGKKGFWDVRGAPPKKEERPKQRRGRGV